jgi:hypothetical protein
VFNLLLIPANPPS